MAKEWDTGICNEKSGFLFSHACFHPPAGNCQLCQKPICADHSHETEGTTVCTACAKKGRRRAGGQGRRYGRTSHYHDGDPYFYGGYYYGFGYYDDFHGSSYDYIEHDPSDFTEADAESLAADVDEGFESDMSES